MPIRLDLPPFPSHDATDDLRQEIEAARSRGNGLELLKLCEEERRRWSERGELLADDTGIPARRLSVEQRRLKRRLQKSNIGAGDVSALIAWLDKATEELRLRHARAA